MISKPISANALLVLPTVSVGNASQRAVDLLISNYDIPFLCNLDVQNCFLPMVTSDPFDPNNPTLITTCTAYYCSKRNVLVFQFRSEFLPHMRITFLQRLQDWLKCNSFRSVIVLSSSWAPARGGQEMITPGIYYLRCPNACKDEDELEALSLFKVSEVPLSLPGSGFAVELYNSMKNSDVPLLLLIKYCDEGWQNVVDAIEIFESLVAVEFDRSQIKELKKPFTWDM